MNYLYPADYTKQIQDANLQQIISADPTILERAQLAAEAEAASYLRQKYDLSAEFTATTAYVVGRTYSGGDRVYLSASPYNASSTYGAGQLARYSDIIWECAAFNVTGPWDPAKWIKLGAANALYYVKEPQPLFNQLSIYRVGDKVFWDSKVYTCAIKSLVFGHESALQVGQVQNIPAPNAIPGTPAGLPQWGAGESYTTNSSVTDMAKWASGDNRDQQLVMYLIDIALYHVHSRIAPRNIPDLRTRRYEAAIDWLKMCADGSVTPNLPLLQPRQGSRIRFGGNVKNINTY